MSPLSIPPFETSKILSQQFCPAEKKIPNNNNTLTHTEKWGEYVLNCYNDDNKLTQKMANIIGGKNKQGWMV